MAQWKFRQAFRARLIQVLFSCQLAVQAQGEWELSVFMLEVVKLVVTYRCYLGLVQFLVARWVFLPGAGGTLAVYYH